MGLKLAAMASSALALAAATPADYVASRQQTDGGFAEPGARSDAALTAWAVLGLKAAGRPPDGTVVYLRDAPVADTTDLALRVMALRAWGEPEPFLTRLRRQRRSNGRIGSLVNSTIWSVLAASERGAASRPLSARTPAAIRRLVVGPGTARRTPTTRQRPFRHSAGAASGAVRSGAGSRSFAATPQRTVVFASSPVESRTPSRRPGRSRPTSPPASSLLPLPSAFSRRSGGRTAATATAGATPSRPRS